MTEVRSWGGAMRQYAEQVLEKGEPDRLIPRRELQEMVVSMWGDLRELREEVAKLQRKLAGVQQPYQSAIESKTQQERML